MIIGIGIDAVDIDRIQGWGPGMVRRYFHPEEIAQVEAKGKGAVMSLAARFAAKEAFGKALGLGLGAFPLKDVRIVNDRDGRPELVTQGRASEYLSRHGGKRVHVSLSHEKGIAIAVVAIEGD